MTDLPPKANLLPHEVAKFMQCSLSSIYDMIHESGLPAFRKDKIIRIPRDLFLEWYRSHIQTQPSDHF